MKRRILVSIAIILILCSSTIMAQYSSYPHFPVNHNHSQVICWGYAVWRAFFNHSENEPEECPYDDVYMTSIPTSFFDEHDWDIDDVSAGDIIDFYKTSQEFPPDGMYHVAYVSSKTASTESGIKLDQAEGEGGPIITNRTLYDTIRGVGELQERGNPTSYWTLKPELF